MPHYVKPMIQNGYIHFDFSCDGTDPKCFLTCPIEHGCEEHYLGWIDAEPWHVDPLGGPPWHRMVAADHCILLDWELTDEDFVGEQTLLREGEVTFEWTGDGYEWTYAGEEQP